MTPDEALQRLMEGNERFRSGQGHVWEYDLRALEHLSESQTPLAAIVGCSDSRVAPEIIFDQPLGTIFACRVPGNVAAESSKWVVDMAVSEFKVPLVMVMGHTGCLAVAQVLKGSGWGMSGMLRLELQTAVSRVRSTDIMAHPEKVVEANAQYAAEQLLQSTQSLRFAVQAGKSRLVAAVYHMRSGEVKVLG